MENILAAQINQKIIELNEYGSSESLLLDSYSFKILQDRFKVYLGMNYSDTYGEIIISAKQYVGIIRIGDTIIKINPKIKLESLFRLLNYCYEIPTQFKEKIDLSLSEEIFNYYIYIFAALVKKLINRGIHKKYLWKEEKLIYLKGRVSIIKNIRENISKPLLNFCSFEEFNENILENIIIKQTLRKLIRIVTDNELLKLLRHDYLYLQDIEESQITSIKDFERISFNRLNENYREPLNLAKFFYENLFIKDEIGKSSVSAFLIDMNKLFENYLYKKLLEYFKDYPINIFYQKNFSFDDNRILSINPDILFYKDNILKIIMDAKYKIIENNNISQADIYQMISYCTKLGVKNCILVFPCFNQKDKISNEFSFFDGEILIKPIFIDLENLNPFSEMNLNIIKTSFDFN